VSEKTKILEKSFPSELTVISQTPTLAVVLVTSSSKDPMRPVYS